MTNPIDKLPQTAQIFVVGGFVRDMLLGLPSKDRDFVVVGVQPQEMLDAGFNQVGADFPVFLHPVTKDEFAIARTERKVGDGYKGFEVVADGVSLEEDLRRRDLTINAMAIEVVDWDDNNEPVLSEEVFDPFGGQRDLQAGKLKHVSKAFAEDPVRVLRVARFRARFNFVVAKSTVELMLEMEQAGELEHLVPERVLAEFEKTLMEVSPNNFVTMRHVGLPEKCRTTIFPNMNEKVVENFALLERASLRRTDLLSRWALLFHTTDDHSMLDALKVSSAVRHAVADLRALMKIQTFSQGEFVLDMLNQMKAFNDDTRLFHLINTIPLLNSDRFINIGDVMIKCWRASKDVNFASLSEEQQQELKGPDIRAAIEEKRLEAVNNFFT